MAVLGALGDLAWDFILIGGLVAGVVRYVSGAVAWMVLHHHMSDWKPFPGREAVEDILRRGNAQPGVFYSIPHMDEFAGGFKDPALTARMQQGPNAICFLTPPGGCMGGKTFAVGFVHALAVGLGAALLAIVLWNNTVLPVSGLLATIAAFAVAGLFVAGTVHGAGRIWMGLPRGHSWKSIADDMVAFAAMGAALYLVSRLFL